MLLNSMRQGAVRSGDTPALRGLPKPQRAHNRPPVAREVRALDAGLPLYAVRTTDEPLLVALGQQPCLCGC